MCGEYIAETEPTAVSSRDIRLWRNILFVKVVLVERRFPKTFSDPEKTPCYVHVNILHTMKQKVNPSMMPGCHRKVYFGCTDLLSHGCKRLSAP